MNISSSQVQKLKITGAPRLDPVTVILEDIAPRQGKIIIECSGKSWSAYWGGMGERTLAEFFTSCNADYLANCLDRGIEAEKYDPTNVAYQLKTLVLQRRRIASQWTSTADIRKRWPHPYDHDALSKEDARDLWRRIDEQHFYHDMGANAAFFAEFYGGEWWRQVPESPNPAYVHLCRVIEAVQAALNTLRPVHEQQDADSVLSDDEQSPTPSA